ncbi:hypothetical protein HOY80DRAFT_1137557 [Tuber brumale]|nr:hypothetical protein HOY80DRAFT_1137557 [Tuber brumale]
MGGIEVGASVNPKEASTVDSVWTDKFTPNEGMYEIPSKVIGLIGCDKNGDSTKKAPANGWSDPDLETIMALKTEKPNPPTNLPSGPGSGPDLSKTNIGAIVGGAVAELSPGEVFARHRNSVGPPVAGAGALGEGGGPAEPMAHNQVNGDRVCSAESPSGEVANEMDNWDWNHVGLNTAVGGK